MSSICYYIMMSSSIESWKKSIEWMNEWMWMKIKFGQSAFFLIMMMRMKFLFVMSGCCCCCYFIIKILNQRCEKQHNIKIIRNISIQYNHPIIHVPLPFQNKKKPKMISLIELSNPVLVFVFLIFWPVN